MELSSHTSKNRAPNPVKQVDYQLAWRETQLYLWIWWEQILNGGLAQKAEIKIHENDRKYQKEKEQ